ncbi:MAG: NADH-quinone oxidoreductase subunit L, partial [Phycisphaerae bacterium]
MATSHTYEILLALGVLFPMVSFWLLVFFGPKMGKPGAGWFGVIMGMGIPLVLSTIVLAGWLGEDPASKAALTENAVRWHWANLGTVPVTVGIKLDSLTVAMFFMVTFVAFWIFFFSVGYMCGHSDEVDGKSKYGRFFAYLSLFGFSMLGLVVSSSLFFLFICWELVGLCSYLLIGFYFDRAYASAAAIKAFVTNRFGDFGFLIGLMLVYFQLHTLDLDQAAVAFAEQHAAHAGIFASPFTLFGWSLATIMGIGLFCGAMGKSAQFPLHVWLPDAMAGPTPVSALIHAATMVAAGVYLVARVFRLMTPEALIFVATIGCLTLFLMALIAIVQVDIKKCLAYSTLSQLGYMIFGMGCGAWIAALFHLITHAFFKAMLFLCSGQVIEGCHHEQDMRKMGGLRKKMPATCWTFFIGVLAISGAGIAGLQVGKVKFGLGGFFSKDEILAVAYTRAYEWEYDKHQVDHHDGSHGSTTDPQVSSVRLANFQPDEHGHAATSDHGDSHGGGMRAVFANIPPLPKWMFWLAIFTAYVTPFYMMRAWWMTFMGKPRDKDVHHHAHEIPLMYIPLVVLAVGTVVA